MNYRPVTDVWFLARAKLKNGKKYYGSYLGGFVERARVLIGCSLNEGVLHVCGGMAREYPYKGGFGPNDLTMDIDPELKPDICQDVRDKWWEIPNDALIKGILIDPPYSMEDADHYAAGASRYPNPNQLISTAINCMDVGGKAGLIHYVLPRCPKNAKFIACVGVICGFGNRMRCFSVFERIPEAHG